MDLRDKVILITGASRGIGAATAILAAKEGARVAVNYNKNEKAAMELVRKIIQENGQVFAIQADVADQYQVNHMIEGVIKKWGRVDVLINNAGVYVDGNFREASVEDIDLQIDINLRGLLYATHAALPIMARQKGGVIVNISSGVGKHGEGGIAVYSATKFAVIGFTQSLAEETENENIRVYAICPGQTATDMGAHAGMPPEKVAKKVIECAKEEVGLHSGGDVEVRS